MGTAVGDLDGDGLPDLTVTNFYGESTTFFRNIGKGIFADQTSAIGLAAPAGTSSASASSCSTPTTTAASTWPTNGHVTTIGPIPLEMPACS